METARPNEDRREQDLLKVGRIVNEVVSKLSRDDASAMMIITQLSIPDTHTEPQEEAKDGHTPG